MAVSRSTRLIAAWIVVGASVSGPRIQAASPPSDCVRTTIGPVVVDVPSVRIRPVFRLDGKPFPGAQAGSAVITLWASDPSPLFDGPQLSLGQTDSPPKSVRVVPGVYDVYYSWQSGNRIPRNQLTRILRRVSLQQDGELVVDVPMVRIAGFKRHNGKPFADDGSSARFRLQLADGRGEVPLGGIVPSAFVVRVIPGLYSFRYDWQAGRAIPRNRRATVLQGLSLDQDVENLVLNVPSVLQDFEFLSNGAPFPSSDIERGDMVLTGEGGDEVPLGSTHLPPQPIRIVPGPYDARFRHVAGGSIVPRNQDGLVERVLVNGSLRVIDVPSVEVSGAFRVNGAVPPATQIINARINLVVPDSPDRLQLGQTRYGAFELRVIPGRYDIEYEHVAGAQLPQNPRAILSRGWDVARVPNRTIDIPAGRFHGSLLLNGEPFPDSDIASGDIYALPLARGASPLILTRTRYNAYDRMLLPGGYQLAYAYVTGGGSGMPRNTFTTFGRPHQVARGENRESPVIDLFAADLTVSYEHRGVPVPAGGPDIYQAHLQRDANYLQLHDSIYGAFDWRVMEGTFDLFYQYRGGPGLPKNAFMRFGCWELVREQSPAGGGGGVVNR